MPRLLFAPVLACLLALPVSRAGAETFVWVDDQGLTHLTDDPGAVPRGEGTPGIDALRSLWSDGLAGPPPPGPAGGSDRAMRLLRGAVDDLGRGEVARATAALHSVLRLDPGRPEAHWYLAVLDGQRGRYESAEEHLESFLSTAGPELGRWREIAQRRLRELADERRLADEVQQRGDLRLLSTADADFRVEFDAELAAARPGYAGLVLGYLEEARAGVSSWLGVVPEEPLGVVFYGKAAYAHAYRHRFSFQTVGFFDGRIHVVSPAHPSSELRSLLFHEYTHAVFRERTGSDRPYWLNEGLAERVERRSREEPASTRSERASLRARIEDGRWLPLRRLAPSFSGLSDEDARFAYLESIVAVGWIEEHSDRDGRARLLARLGGGFSADQALFDLLGIDTDGLDAAVRKAILAEFPAL